MSERGIERAVYFKSFKQKIEKASEIFNVLIFLTDSFMLPTGDAFILFNIYQNDVKI